ncbi:MAG: hypothetical protein PF569_06855 [Candidatus Woesearchaeota archaeon]|jgi:hypothetical protein|nr:hypothetical protein [Candidatus Woesearchaeota archaeon]
MRIINRVERKGSLVEFEKGDILEELRQVRKNQFYLYFSSLIDLEILELKILKHILQGNNKEIAFQTLDKRYKKVWLLSWNKYCNRLIYRDIELKYTLIFSRGGVLIYPNSLDINKCLKVSLHFLGTLEMAGCLR